MKFPVSLSVICSIIAWIFVTSIHAQPTVQQQKDSLRQAITLTDEEEKLRTYNRLVSLYMRELRKENVIDTVFSLLDELEAEAQKQGNVSFQGTARTNKLVSLSNVGGEAYNRLIDEAPATLDFLSRNELWRQYYSSAMLISDSYRRKGEYEQALAEAQKVFDFAKEHQHSTGMGLAVHAMSRIYSSQRRFADAETGLREAIELLSPDDSYLNNLASVHTDLIQNLVAQKRYDDALLVAAQTEEVNRRYEKSSGLSQPSAWNNLWYGYLNAYLQSGDYDNAEIYIHKIDSLYGGNQNLSEHRAQVLYGKKRYPEALEMAEEAIASARNKLQPKGLKMMILIEMGRSQEAFELFREIIVEMDAKSNADFNARLDELRTQYEVDKHIAEKERNRNYFLLALAGCILLALLLVAVFYYNRMITAKNRGLYRQIKEQDRLAEELAQLTQNYETLSTSVSGKAKEEAPASLPGDKAQRQLVAHLRTYLLDEGNLTNLTINREELASALGTNINTLSEAVKTVTGKTFMEYTRFLQLEEFRRILDAHPELTIEAIAFDCGFNSLPTFYRLFRKQYGITPTEYRKMATTIDN